MDEFQVLADLGRILRKVDIGEYFLNFTADQWRIFFSIYVTVSLWEHLPIIDQKILTYFVRISSILVNRIVKFTLVQEAHQRLISLIELIEEKYGRNKITPNLHLLLHLSDCSYNYGPQYVLRLFLLFKGIKSLYYSYTIVNFTALNLQGITSLHLLITRVGLLLLKSVRLFLQTTGVA